MSAVNVIQMTERQNKTIPSGPYFRLSDKTPEMRRKEIGNYALAALICMIMSVIMISVKLWLIAGILVIISAAVLLLILRKTMLLIDILDESLIEASVSNKEKENIIKNFSHRIREPLNTLLTISEMFMDSGLQKKQKELMETFLASTGNMITTVNELSVESAGSLSYKPKNNIRFNILTSIQNAIELYQLKEKSNLDFILNRKDFSAYECEGDPVILKQIILDLFNTIENQGEDMVTRVAINLKKEKDEGRKMIVNIRIQTDRNIVFMNEEQTAGHLSSKLIRKFNGMYNQEFGDNSSVVNIYLPFSYPASEQKQKPAVQKSEDAVVRKKKGSRKDLKSLNILLAEDNLITQKVTLLTLKPLVKNIDTVLNGNDALEKIQSTEYDLILMDISMPVMDGITTAKKIREFEKGTGSHIPIIAITANAMIDDHEKCLAAGIDDCLCKPYSSAVLLEKISKLMS